MIEIGSCALIDVHSAGLHLSAAVLFDGTKTCAPMCICHPRITLILAASKHLICFASHERIVLLENAGIEACSLPDWRI